MEGPYRDLGSGFVRLAGAEGARRAPSRITTVEAALLELIRNAHEASATNVYVASALRRRRFRHLTVIDDGDGIPEHYADLIFEPGVTNRHLDPDVSPHGAAHGAGLSLYHLKNAALEARLLSASSPTAIHATFDTAATPERSLQSTSRPSASNLRATLQSFLQTTHSPPNLYYASPSGILAILLKNRIIQENGADAVRGGARRLGLAVSLRTVQRVLAGRILAAEGIEGSIEKVGGERGTGRGESGRVVWLTGEEEAEIGVILQKVARARYLEAGRIKFDSGPGELSVKVSFHEPEEEYE